MPDPEPTPDPDPAADPTPNPEPEDAPSLREQIGATRSALKRLIGAHVELGKAEIGEVLDEVKKVAVLAGVAIGAAIAAALLVAVGLPLFLGEWIFGSIGWGILHGLLLLAAIAVASVVVALGVDGAAVGRSLAVGLLAGVVVGVGLGLNLTHSGWALLGEGMLPMADPEPRPLATAVVVLPVLLGLLLGLGGLVQALRSGQGEAGSAPGVGERVAVGLPTAIYVGWLAAFGYAYTSRVAWPDPAIVAVGLAGFSGTLVVLGILASWRPGFAFNGGLALGAWLGIALAGLTAIEFGRRAAAALGVTVGLLAFIGVLGAEVARRGVDTEQLKKRFIPEKTMDVTKETIEWVRARTPLSRRS